jgi:hypothetical protein
MKTRRATIVALLASAASILSTTPAGAQTVRHHDASGDVVRANAEGTVLTPVPHRRQGDITWVRATYHRHSLVLVMRFAALTMERRTQFHYFSVHTSTGLERDALVNSGRKYPRGAAVLADRRGSYLRCHIGHRVSYRHNTVSVRIPAGCLGRTPWVRVGFGEANGPQDLFGMGPMFVDEGYLSGPMSDEAVTNGALTYGPRVRRG